MIKKILDILKEIKPDFDIDSDTNLIESGVLDSFDLLLVVSELESKLETSIPGEMLLPENFETALAIEKMLTAL